MFTSFFETPISPMEKCPNSICEQNKNLLFKDCPTCGSFWWYPNVENANQLEEREALESNYQHAVREADAGSSRDTLNKFEKAVSDSFVVVNMKDALLLQFLNNDTMDYKNHYLLVEEGIIAPYPLQEEGDRSTTESKLFPLYYKEIRYGALSIDGYGLESYGNIAVKLKSDLIKNRTSFFVENSLAFMKRYKIQVFGSFPKGFLAIWENRCKLAVSKEFDPEKNSPEETDFAKLLLNSTNVKFKDRFVEAH
ncbi:MAG: hypothetical protein IIA62_02325, partial [Nitrospinae bacterium]|nr:hypothetical protein [Nitrospinota bacterium]